MQLSPEMRVARLHRFDDIRIETMPTPEPGPYDALIRTKVCGICSGDVMPWYIENKAPLVLGHEPSGEIISVGSQVTSFSPGDRVFVHHHAPCFLCGQCRKGNYVHCDIWRKSRIIPGGLSEYILVPQVNLENDTLTLPANVTYEDGALVEPVACVVKALKRSNVRHGDTVLIIGLGVMGQMHVLLSRKYGAGKIIGADMVPFRLGKAKEFGADAVIDVSRHDLLDSLKELTGGACADVVVVGPNSVRAMEQGIAAAGAGGRVLLFTPAKPQEQLVVDPNDLYFRDVTIVTSYSCGPTDTADALELIQEGVVRAKDLVTHRFSLEDAANAFMLTAEAKDSLKSIIVFD